MNPYEILELKAGANADEVKSAYHRLAKQWHPDRFSGEQKLEAEQRFRQLNEAFNMLKGVAPKAPEPSTPPPPPHPSTPPTAAAPGVPALQDPDPTESGIVRVGVMGWCRRAEDALVQNRLNEALAFIQYALRLDPEKHELHAVHARILEAVGTDRRALVGALEQCVRLDPKDADAHARLAELYQKMGMQARATRHWETLAQIVPNHPRLRKRKVDPEESAPAPAEGLGGQVRQLLDQARGLFSRFGRKP